MNPACLPQPSPNETKPSTRKFSSLEVLPQRAHSGPVVIRAVNRAADPPSSQPSPPPPDHWVAVTVPNQVGFAAALVVVKYPEVFSPEVIVLIRLGSIGE